MCVRLTRRFPIVSPGSLRKDWVALCRCPGLCELVSRVLGTHTHLLPMTATHVQEHTASALLSKALTWLLAGFGGGGYKRSMRNSGLEWPHCHLCAGHGQGTLAEWKAALPAKVLLCFSATFSINLF